METLERGTKAPFFCTRRKMGFSQNSSFNSLNILLCCMKRLVGILLILGLVLTFFVAGVSAQTPIPATKAPNPTLVFGDTIGMGATLQYVMCAEDRCIQQSNTTLDSTPNAFTGLYVDVQTPADEKPFITYVVHYHPFIYELRTLKCGNAACNQGNVIQSITFADYQSRTKIQLNPTTNLPAFVYHAFGTSYFVQCTNADCSQRVQNTLGSTTTQQISNQWIFAADGTPMIATLTGSLLNCGDALCSTPPTEIISATSRKLTANSVRIIMAPDGNPVITYMNRNLLTSDFYFSKCLDTRCNKRTTTHFGNWVNSPGTEFEHDVIIGSDRLPAFVYQRETFPVLEYVHCSTSDCTQHTSTTLAISSMASSAGQNNTLMVGADGKPTIAYHDKMDLHYIHCSDNSCTNTAQNYSTVLRPAAGTHVAMTLV